MVTIVFVACSTSADRYDRSQVASSVAERTGLSIGPGDDSLPSTVSLDDGVQEDEGVTLALWRNPSFQEALAELGLRRADLVQAGEFPNPLVTVLFPLGPKQLELAAKLPFDFLWQRSARIASARFDCERLSALLVQGALDVVRDVRQAFAELRLARARVAILQERVEVAAAIAEGLARRLAAGDASVVDERAAHLQALAAAAEVARADLDANRAVNRLRSLVGTPLGAACAFDARIVPGPSAGDAALADTLVFAMALRPDLRSAELGVEAAGERIGLAKWEILSLTGIADANGSGSSFESGPGIEWKAPVLSQNQAAVDRAHAEIERALRHRNAVGIRIEFEVREAHARRLAARDRLTAMAAMAAVCEVAAERARRAHVAGDEALLAVHEARLQLLDAQLRVAEAAAELQSAEAQLIRSVGGKSP